MRTKLKENVKLYEALIAKANTERIACLQESPAKMQRIYYLNGQIDAYRKIVEDLHESIYGWSTN